MFRTLAICLLAVFAVQTALATPQATGSNINQGDTFATVPENYYLHFTEPVRLQSLTVTNETGDTVALAVTPPPKASYVISAPLPALKPGKHILRWRVITDKAEAINGEVIFFVTP